MEWIKFYTGKWLYGSGRTMSAEKRGVWADLMALAAETKFRDGSLRFEVDEPMPRSYICAILRISPDLLDSCIDAFVRDLNTDDGLARISIWDDGTIFLNNFERYQAIPEDKRRLTPREVELLQRKQLNMLGSKFPIEALNIPEVKAIVEGELHDKDTA